MMGTVTFQRFNAAGGRAGQKSLLRNDHAAPPAFHWGEAVRSLSGGMASMTRFRGCRRGQRARRYHQLIHNGPCGTFSAAIFPTRPRWFLPATRWVRDRTTGPHSAQSFALPLFTYVLLYCRVPRQTARRERPFPPSSAASAATPRLEFAASVFPLIGSAILSSCFPSYRFRLPLFIQLRLRIRPSSSAASMASCPAGAAALLRA